jgi:predicted membrane channel-forming protein YqfA (hemolysin III family)
MQLKRRNLCRTYGRAKERLCITGCAKSAIVATLFISRANCPFLDIPVLIKGIALFAGTNCGFALAYKPHKVRLFFYVKLGKMLLCDKLL